MSVHDEFRWNIYAKKISAFLRDFKKLITFWKSSVKVSMTKEVVRKLKNASTSSSEFESYGHIRFDENEKKKIPYMDIIYDLDTFEVLSVETKYKDKKKIFKPGKNPSRHLYLTREKSNKKGSD